MVGVVRSDDTVSGVCVWPKIKKALRRKRIPTQKLQRNLRKGAEGFGTRKRKDLRKEGRIAALMICSARTLFQKKIGPWSRRFGEVKKISYRQAALLLTAQGEARGR